MKLDTEKKVLDAFVQSRQALSAKDASELSGLEKKEADKMKLKDSRQLESLKKCYYQVK